MGGHRQVEAEELVLRIQCHRGRGAEAEEVDLAGLDHQVHGAADQLRIEALAGAVQRGDGRAEDLACVFRRAVVGLYRLADIGGAAGQALRQLHLQFRVAADAERAAEAIHRRLADLCGLRQGGDAEAGGLLRVAQDDFGHLALGLVEVFDATLDLLEQVVYAVHDDPDAAGQRCPMLLSGLRSDYRNLLFWLNVVFITTSSLNKRGFACIHSAVLVEEQTS